MKIWIHNYLVLFELGKDYYSVINFSTCPIPRKNKRKRIRWMHIYLRAYQSYKMVPPEFANEYTTDVKYIHELRNLIKCCL